MADRHGEDRNEDRELLETFGTRLKLAVIAAGGPNSTPDRNQHLWLADRLGYSTSGVRRWFVGESIPSPSMLKRICKVLDVSLDFLFGIESGQAGESVSSGQVRCIALRQGASASVAGASIDDLEVVTRLSASQSDHALSDCWLVQAWSAGGLLGWRQGDWLVVDTRPESFTDGHDALVVNAEGVASFRVVSTTASGRVVLETATHRYKEEFKAADVELGPAWPLQAAATGVRIAGVVTAALP